MKKQKSKKAQKQKYIEKGPFDFPRDYWIECKRKDKNLSKLAEKKDYWRRFQYKGKTYTKSFQGLLERKKLYEWEYLKMVNNG